MPSAAQTKGPTPRQIQEERAQRLFRRARRKAREAAGEIKELNIVAMMDMMTIILVFLLKSYQASAINVTLGEHMSIPASTSEMAPQENITITVSMSAVEVNHHLVLALKSGQIPAEAKDGGKAESLLVPAIREWLGVAVNVAKESAKQNKDHAFKGRVNIVADKRVSYRTLMEVLYTAGQAELADYHFMVLQKD